MNRTGTLRRIWLLMAQVIAVAAGLLIAWRAFAPAPVAAPHADGVALRALAVGDPFGVGQTMTQGIVSATGRNRLGIRHPCAIQGAARR